MMKLPPPPPFSLDTVLCPSCDHGIDTHQASGYCAVGENMGYILNLKGERIPKYVTCSCVWSPNDIAAVRIMEAT